MKTRVERKTLKRDRHSEVKHDLKEKRSMPDESRGRGEFHRDRLDYVLESGI
jgi:hypothetical protein